MQAEKTEHLPVRSQVIIRLSFEYISFTDSLLHRNTTQEQHPPFQELFWDPLKRGILYL